MLYMSPSSRVFTINFVHVCICIIWNLSYMIDDNRRWMFAFTTFQAQGTYLLLAGSGLARARIQRATWRLKERLTAAADSMAGSS
jgi:hypothetical protein